MRKTIAALIVLSLAGCIARSADDYKIETRKVLSAQDGAIKACYDTQLASNASQSGTVVVRFTVEKKTGVFTTIAADPNESTAPESLQQCVTGALEGLKFVCEGEGNEGCPDRRDGDATFTWVFKG